MFQLSSLRVLKGRSVPCKYCSSDEVVNAQSTDQHAKRRSFTADVKIVDIGLSVSLGKDKGSSLSYQTRFCKKCYNIHVADSSTIYDPILIGAMFVIPYALAVLLKTNCYTEKDILQFVLDNAEMLKRIQNKWSKKGEVPCRHGRVGYKMKLKLKNDLKIMCWIIVDTIRDKLAYRMAYGGAKVNCP